MKKKKRESGMGQRDYIAPKTGHANSYSRDALAFALAFALEPGR